MRGLSLVLAAASTVTSAAADPATAPPSLTGDEIFARLVEHNQQRENLLRHYSVRRTYSAENKSGKVYAVDIDAKLLDIAGKNAPANLVTVLATPDDPKLPDGAIDTVFFCDVLHHVENRTAYYGKLSKALKPGGRVVVVDFYKKKLPVGPPESMKLTENEVTAEFKAAGFTRVAAHKLPYQYFLIFARR